MAASGVVKFITKLSETFFYIYNTHPIKVKRKCLILLIKRNYNLILEIRLGVPSTLKNISELFKKYDKI